MQNLSCVNLFNVTILGSSASGILCLSTSHSEEPPFIRLKEEFPEDMTERLTSDFMKGQTASDLSALKELFHRQAPDGPDRVSSELDPSIGFPIVVLAGARQTWQRVSARKLCHAGRTQVP